MKKFPLTMQMEVCESGAAVLHSVMAYYKKYIPFSEVRDNTAMTRNETSVKQLCDAAAYYGLNTKVTDISRNTDVTAAGFTMPLILQKPGGYIVLTGIRGKKAFISDPSRGSFKMDTEELAKAPLRTAIEIMPSADFKEEGRPVSTIAIIKKHVSAYKRTSRKLFMINILLTLCTIATMVLTSRLMDDVIDGGREELFIPVTAAMAAVLLAQLFLNVRQSLMILRESRENTADSGAGLYKTVLGLPVSFYESHSPGSIAMRISGNINIDRTFMMTIIPEVMCTVLTFAFFITMLFYNPAITIAFLVFEALYAAASAAVRTRSGETLKSMSCGVSRMSAEVLNGVSMIETIKTSGAERDYFMSWARSNDACEQNRKDYNKINTRSMLVDYIHMTLTSGGLLILGGYFMMQGKLTIGAYSVLQSVVYTVDYNLSTAIRCFTDVQRLRTDIERTEDILERDTVPEVELEGEAAKLTGKISIKNVSFRYPGADKPAVENLNLEIEPGETVALVGSSGSGKSTILKLLTGIYKPTEGEILYDSENMAEIPAAVLRESIAAVDQETVMFNDSISDNLKLWDPIIDDYSMTEAARDARIYDSIMDYHGGFDSEIVENGRNFSGGELQRLEIARVMVKEPSIMILDEFTSALDVVTEKEICETIRSKKVTSVMVVHRKSGVMGCDRAAVIEGGRIVEMGRPDELLSKNGAFAKLMEGDKAAV